MYFCTKVLLKNRHFHCFPRSYLHSFRLPGRSFFEKRLLQSALSILQQSLFSIFIPLSSP